jgi:hypothetical protein
MGLPKAVIEAAKRAEELSKKLDEKPVVEEEEVVVDDEPDIDSDDSALGEEEEVIDETDFDEVVEDDDDEEEDDTIVEDKENTLEYWKNRFLTLQGKYNNEVPQLSRKIRELEAQRVSTVNIESDDVDVEEISKLKPEDFEDYGDEFITLVKAVNSLEKRNKQLESLAQSVTTQSQATNLETFKARLSEIVPDWEAINNNQDFITWLQEPDGYSGLSMHEALLKAYNQFNSETVGKIFNKFKAEFKIPISKNKKPKQSLRSEIQPKGVKTKQVVTQRKKGREWTRAQIAEFYRNKTDGKIDPKKAAKLEKDIFLANQEGRIVA